MSISKNAFIAFDERLRFEKLLSDLSAEFINLPADEVDGKIEHGLRIIGEFLKIDRCTLFEFEDNMARYRVTHTWMTCKSHSADPLIAIDRLPWVTQHTLEGKSVRFTKINDLPDNAVSDKNFFNEQGIKSGISIPLSVGGIKIGMLTLTTYRAERRWPKELEKRLRLIGGVFSNALVRKNSQEVLEERLCFQQLVSKISAHFINLPAGEIDKAIEDGLRLIGEHYDADLVHLGQVSIDERDLRPSHMWRSRKLDQRLGTIPPNRAGTFPHIGKHLQNNCNLIFEKVEDIPEKLEDARRFVLNANIKSAAMVPFSVEGAMLGCIVINSVQKEKSWPEEVAQHLKIVGEVFGNALNRKHNDLKLQKAFAEINELKEQLQAENFYLRKEVKLVHQQGEIIGHSKAIKEVMLKVAQVAKTDATVLLLGETGTGKELIARAIHNQSSRKGKALIKVKCAAVPSTLAESELFGREKGAFTGAHARQIGRFEAANKSTILLDEIGELSLDVQAKLLRVLQEGQFERLGSPNTMIVDVRIIAATNRDLAKSVENGSFREDLYYRLNVFPISLPPLRHRREDIPSLVWLFVKYFGDKMGKMVEKIPRKSMDAVQGYVWPGNVRELRNVIERSMIIASGPVLHIDMPQIAKSAINHAMSLDEVQKKHINNVLEMTGGRVRGHGGAAEILGMKPTTLDYRMLKLGIKHKQ